jgi:hypothetical protein
LLIILAYAGCNVRNAGDVESSSLEAVLQHASSVAAINWVMVKRVGLMLT